VNLVGFYYNNISRCTFLWISKCNKFISLFIVNVGS